MFASRHRSEVVELTPVGILAGCPRVELELIAQRSEVAEVPAGRVLCEQGAVALDCILVESGCADVFLNGQRVATIGPGETVGEMGSLDRRPRSATVVARTPLRVRIIRADDLDALTISAPMFSHALLRELSARLRDLDTEFRRSAVGS